MKKVIYIISTFVLLASINTITGESNALALVTDSCALQKQQAVTDFKKREFKVGYIHCRKNEYYAEEIFYKRYNLKIEIGEFDMGCIVPGPAEVDYHKRYCYYQAIDSLLYRKLGKDIYYRVYSSADSFALVDPHRYDCQPFGWPVYVPNNDSIIPDLRKVLHYPTTNCIEGVVYVAIKIDTSGNVSDATVVKGVRHDLDSAAIASVKQLGQFTPVRRWGIPEESEIRQPIRFARY